MQWKPILDKKQKEERLEFAWLVVRRFWLFCKTNQMMIMFDTSINFQITRYADLDHGVVFSDSELKTFLSLLDEYNDRPSGFQHPAWHAPSPVRV